MAEEKQLEAWQAQELDTLQQQIRLAGEAQSLLSNRALEEWLRGLESNCYDILDSLPLSDDAGRKHTVLLIGMARKFKSAMEDYVKTGEMSVERLQVLLNIKEEKK